MRMKRIALVLLFAALPLPCRSQFVPEQTPGDAVSREVVSWEKLAWERAKKKDKAGLAELLAQDFTEIIDDGVFDRAQILTYLDHITLNSYSPSGLKVKRIASDAVLLIYQVSESGKYDDQPFKQTVNAASLWMKRGEQWQNVLFQETPAPN